MRLPRIITDQPVRFFALVCVAITSAYVMYMGHWLVNIMAGPGWCNRTIAANKVVPDSSFDALKVCTDLLTLQIKGVVTVSYIYAGTIALCLLTLMVIVVAGGHLSFTSPLGSANMGGDKDEAATKVANAAVDEAQKIIGETKIG